jgi:hypothetical protein
MSKAANTKRVKMISKEAKKLYDHDKSGIKWTDAIKKASTELKKKGKL